MRQLQLLGLVLFFFASLAGCRHCYQVHGICDCQYDDHCETRQPWIGNKCGTVANGTGGCANGSCAPR